MTFHSSPQTFVKSVELTVADLERSLSFYKDMLGFSILKRNENKIDLTLDGVKPLLSIQQLKNPQPKQARTSGLYHFALLLPNRKELAKVLRHLMDSGYPLQGASDHLVSEAIYFADPDGHGIEIYIDRDPETWQWDDGQVSMTTEALDAKGLLQESVGTSFTGLPQDTLMGHLHLHVPDLVKAEEFYCIGLGFDVVLRFSNHALFISTGGYHHHIGLNIWNGPGAPPPALNHARLTLFTVVYPNAKARDEAVGRLEKLGYAVQVADGAYLAEDPSGTNLELLIDKGLKS